jgi:hypothetical protein
MKLKACSKEIISSSLLYLHQCKQCGVIFEGDISKAVFSSDSKFMVDKCDNCKRSISFTKIDE